MDEYAILRTEKLTSLGNIAGSCAHVARTLKEKKNNINKEKTHLNKVFVGSSNPARDIQNALPQKRRKNAVLAVEIIMTATNSFFENKTKEEIEQWAKDSIDEAGVFWHKQNIVSATLHLDEETPHLHIYSVPKVNGKLNCRQFIGGAGKLSKMQTQYAIKMEKYNLKRGIAGSQHDHLKPKIVAGRSNAQPKIKTVNVPVAKKKEATLFGLQKTQAIKKTRFATVESAKKVETEAAKVPLLQHRVTALTKTLEKKQQTINTYKTKEEIGQLREFDLTEICAKFGYLQNAKDPKKYHTPTGTVSITNQKFKDFSSGVGGGGAIDFVMYAENVDFKQAVEMLSSNVGANFAIQAVQKKVQVDFINKKTTKAIKPSNDPTLTPQLLNWLVLTRKIPTKIAEEWISNGRVYANKFRNAWQAVFVHSENAFHRINPNTEFKGWVQNSKVNDVMFVNKPTLKKQTAITESHLDGISLQVFKPNLNVAIAGSAGSIAKFAKQLEEKGHQILLAPDNDPAGRAVIEKLPQYKAILSIKKDWNDDLMAQGIEKDASALKSRF